MKSYIGVLILFLIVINSSTVNGQQSKYEDILGNWKVLTVDTLEKKEFDHSLIKISLKQNGMLSVLHIDLRPSSVVKVDESELTFENNILNYSFPGWGGGIEYFEGTISKNKNIIRDVNKTRYILVWKRCSDSKEIQTSEFFEKVLNHSNKIKYKYNQPLQLKDGWQCSDMNREGLNNKIITKLINRILKGKYEDIHNLLIIKNRKLVVEEYFRGNGQIYSEDIKSHFRNRIHLSASSTKSFTSTLIGIAIDKNLIDNIDVPVFDFFPKYEYLLTEDKKKILLKHFLTMTAGLEWNNEFSTKPDHIEMWKTDDVIKLNLEKPVIAEPGELYQYSNGLSTCLGAIINNVSGMPVDTFADKYLFEPLKINKVQWSKYPDGTFDTDGNLALRPRDFAKIGQLFLDSGRWENKQIVSPEWVSESTKKHVKRTETLSYGYQWWQTDFKVKSKIINSYHTWGMGGQYVFVFPEFQLVVSSNAGNFKYKPERYTFKMIEKYILPAILENEKPE